MDTTQQLNIDNPRPIEILKFKNTFFVDHSN